MYVCTQCACSAIGIQKRVPSPLEVEVQVGRGTEPKSFAGTASALNF